MVKQKVCARLVWIGFLIAPALANCASSPMDWNRATERCKAEGFDDYRDWGAKYEATLRSVTHEEGTIVVRIGPPLPGDPYVNPGWEGGVIAYFCDASGTIVDKKFER